MKYKILLLFITFSVLILACNSKTSKHTKSEDELMDEKVDKLIEEDEAKIDSFKKANGLE